MRATYSPCSRCKGKGQIKVSGEAVGEASAAYTDCGVCNATGVERKLHDDHIKCVCGVTFHSVSDLAVHRRSTHG